MPRIGSLSIRTRAIIIQALILAGLVVYFKFALPKIEESRRESRLNAREEAIGNFFGSVTVEVGSDPGTASASKAKRARRLRLTPDVHEAQRELGAPDQNMTDYAGAQHFTWLGSKRRLLASFNKGQLYSLTLSDLAGSHGERVFESSAQYQEF